MENTQTKPQSKWTVATMGKLWANKDSEGKLKNFSGTITIDGKERRIFVSRRLKYDNDDPAKNYPALIIYDPEKLDSFNDSGKSAGATTKKAVAKAVPVEEEVAEELI